MKVLYDHQTEMTPEELFELNLGALSSCNVRVGDKLYEIYRGSRSSKIEVQ